MVGSSNAAGVLWRESMSRPEGGHISAGFYPCAVARRTGRGMQRGAIVCGQGAEIDCGRAGEAGTRTCASGVVLVSGLVLFDVIVKVGVVAGERGSQSLRTRGKEQVIRGATHAGGHAV